MKNHPKPRVGFCWECGRKLQGRHHEEVVLHDAGAKEQTVIMHEDCAKDYRQGSVLFKSYYAQHYKDREE